MEMQQMSHCKKKKKSNFKTENNKANQNMQDSKDKIDTTRTKYRRTC